MKATPESVFSLYSKTVTLLVSGDFSDAEKSESEFRAEVERLAAQSAPFKREDLTLAAVNCEHQIDADCVRLWRDETKEGTALSQLVDRVVAAAAQSAPTSPTHAGAVRQLATLLGFSELFIENDKLGTATMLNAVARITRLEAEAAVAQSAPLVQQAARGDAALSQTIGERDNYQKWADKLAKGIASHLGIDIGGHAVGMGSAESNNPWANALEAIQSADQSTPTEPNTSDDAYKWAYEYLQSRMKSIDRHGWAHDCDSEIQARIEARRKTAPARQLVKEHPPLPDPAIVIEDEADAEEGAVELWGHKNSDIIVGAQFFSADQMRAYVDADRAAAMPGKEWMEEAERLIDAHAEKANANGVEFVASNEPDLARELEAKRALLAHLSLRIAPDEAVKDAAERYYIASYKRKIHAIANQFAMDPTTPESLDDALRGYRNALAAAPPAPEAAPMGEDALDMTEIPVEAVIERLAFLADNDEGSSVIARQTFKRAAELLDFYRIMSLPEEDVDDELRALGVDSNKAAEKTDRAIKGALAALKSRADALQARVDAVAPIQDVYDKLHAGKLGAHWLWVVIEQIAAGIPEADAMREFGYYEKSNKTEDTALAAKGQA